MKIEHRNSCEYRFSLVLINFHQFSSILSVSAMIAYHSIIVSSGHSIVRLDPFEYAPVVPMSSVADFFLKEKDLPVLAVNWHLGLPFTLAYINKMFILSVT